MVMVRKKMRGSQNMALGGLKTTLQAAHSNHIRTSLIVVVVDDGGGGVEEEDGCGWVRR